ncbi:MAG: hypothetical protein HYR72_03995 [Deltaproteobacteria bacterium]|nr:hypothetical protein [Deltaproteobacteria bacterium]MBI3388650.1 hypothetical protein [Deltaproteobacteria bacterium]
MIETKAAMETEDNPPPRASVNYRRGLTRLYVVISALWIAFVLVGVPWWARDTWIRNASVALEQKKQEMSSRDAALKKSPIDQREADEHQRLADEHQRDAEWFRQHADNWWSETWLAPRLLSLWAIALGAIPIALYGILYALISGLDWAKRGFRNSN